MLTINKLTLIRIHTIKKNLIQIVNINTLHFPITKIYIFILSIKHI